MEIHLASSSLHSKWLIPTLSDPDNLKLISLDEVFVLGNMSPRMPARAKSILVQAVLFLTLILNDAVPTLPALSAPLHDTLVVRWETSNPENGPQTTSMSHRQDRIRVLLYMITLPEELATYTTESAGTLNVGGVVSVEFVEPLCDCANTFEGLLYIDKPKELINTNIVNDEVNPNNRKSLKLLYIRT